MSFQLVVIDLASVKEWATHGDWGENGRVTINGIATHALMPASGQGASMAFEDSVLLCRNFIVDASSKLNTTT